MAKAVLTLEDEDLQVLTASGQVLQARDGSIIIDTILRVYFEIFFL